MNLSAKTEYACIALMELALHRGGDPVRIRAIADAHGVPSRFLVQILLQLKAAGLVRSTRGAAGGYRLAQPPQGITLADVMDAVEGPLESANPSAGRSTAVTQALQRTWQDVGEALRAKLESITIARLAEESGVPTENMYYI